jgi:hypothetical protein
VQAMCRGGRSSGDDGGLVEVQRIAVACVEKSVGAGRDEAGPQEDAGGHGKKNGASDQDEGGRVGTHLTQFMQPLFLIGDAAPDR